MQQPVPIEFDPHVELLKIKWAWISEAKITAEDRYQVRVLGCWRLLGKLYGTTKTGINKDGRSITAVEIEFWTLLVRLITIRPVST